MKLFNAQTKAKSVGLSLLGGAFFLMVNVISTGAMAAKTAQYVVVAQDHLAPGILLTAEDFTLQTIKGDAPAGSYSKIADLVNQHLLVGAVKGEPVIHTMVSDPKKQVTINNLPQGFVALWIQASIGATGYLSIGDTVNLYDNKGVVIGGGKTFQVIGAVDNQGNPIKPGTGTGTASAVELAVPDYLASSLIQNIANLKLVLNPWGNVISSQNGGIPNDQTNLVNPSGSSSSPYVPSGNPSNPQSSSGPGR